MNMRDLIPWSRNAGQSPMVYNDPQASPFLALHREVNRLFDEAFHNFRMPSLFAGFSTWPNVEVTETDSSIRVAAEIPGLDEKDVDVLLEDGVLTIRGEKKSETTESDNRFSERFYGHFQRQIPIEADIDEDKVEASFRNGVLTVTLPKTEKARAKAKRIAVNKH